MWTASGRCAWTDRGLLGREAGGPSGRWPGGSRVVPMATEVAGRVAARARLPAVAAGVPILAAKITVPDWVVPPPRITKLIDQRRRWCPLTVITAPAGAGKTMALALWAAAEPESVAWVGLDEYDNAPEVFWSYLVAALRPGRRCRPGGVAGRAGAGRRARVRAGAGGGAGGPGPAADAGPGRPASADRPRGAGRA